MGTDFNVKNVRVFVILRRNVKISSRRKIRRIVVVRLCDVFPAIRKGTYLLPQCPHSWENIVNIAEGESSSDEDSLFSMGIERNRKGM